jgi:sRNA-binding protein
MNDDATKRDLWNEARQALREIAARFPEAFQFPIRPLSVTARQDLIASGYDKAVVYRVLKLYCGRIDYLKAVAHGARRVNLDGSDADLPEQSHIEHARERLKTLLPPREKPQRPAAEPREQRPDRPRAAKAKPPQPPKAPKPAAQTAPPTAMGAALGEALARLKNGG